MTSLTAKYSGTISELIDAASITNSARMGIDIDKNNFSQHQAKVVNVNRCRALIKKLNSFAAQEKLAPVYRGIDLDGDEEMMSEINEYIRRLHQKADLSFLDE